MSPDVAHPASASTPRPAAEPRRNDRRSSRPVTSPAWADVSVPLSQAVAPVLIMMSVFPYPAAGQDAAEFAAQSRRRGPNCRRTARLASLRPVDWTEGLGGRANAAKRAIEAS